MKPPTRPVLRYHGGKFRLAPWIISHFPAHRIYVEPYGGAASILMQKPRCYAEVLNDLDEEIVSLYRVLRNPQQSAELERRLRLTPFARQEFYDAYEQTDCEIERARKCIIRGAMGFGSSGVMKKTRTGFRSKVHNSYATGSEMWAKYPDSLPAFLRRLQGVTIENLPALELIAKNDTPDTLIYCDPPYVHQTRSMDHGSSIYRHEMTDADHRELAETLHDCKSMVVLSGYDCPLYQEVFRDWIRVEKSTRIDGGKTRIESLWLNPLVVRHAPQLRLDLEEAHD